MYNKLIPRLARGTTSPKKPAFFRVTKPSGLELGLGFPHLSWVIHPFSLFVLHYIQFFIYADKDSRIHTLSPPKYLLPLYPFPKCCNKQKRNPSLLGFPLKNLHNQFSQPLRWSRTVTHLFLVRNIYKIVFANLFDKAMIVNIGGNPGDTGKTLESQTNKFRISVSIFVSTTSPIAAVPPG